jgi:hypothetical protein
MVIWFGMLRMDESMSELQDHLRRLRQRFLRLGKRTDIVIYVDNCCIVRDKILEAWPDAIVKLDIFHWLKRWNQILRKPQSVDAGVFHALMSRAVLIAEFNEFNRVKAQLQAKVLAHKRSGPVTNAEVHRLCKTVAPNKELMERLIMNVISYTMRKDGETEIKLATWNEQDHEQSATKPELVLKRGVEAEKVIQNQLSHVRQDCLSDPPNFELYSQVNGQWKCARGSSSNERNNRSIEEKAFSTSLGLKTAERRTWIEFDRHNTSNNIRRCGAVNTYTSNHEGCALLNSIAGNCGHNHHYPDLSMPSIPTNIPVDRQEKIGFDLYFESITMMVEPTVANNSTGGSSSDSDHDSDSDRDLDSVTDELPQALVYDPVLNADQQNQDAIDRQQEAATAALAQQAEMHEQLMSRSIRPAENTMQTFRRMGGDGIWTPFEKDSSGSVVAEAEHELFIQMEKDYKRNVSPSANRGYNAFSKAWNKKAAERMIACFQTGDNDKSIRFKTSAQLQDYCDYLQQLEAAAMTTTVGEVAGRHALNSALYHARRLQEEPVPRVAAPVQYANYANDFYVPLGHPIQMNATLFGHYIGRQQSIGNVAPYRVPFTPSVIPLTEAQLPTQTDNKNDARNECKDCCGEKKDHPTVNGVHLFGSNLCTGTYCYACHQVKMKHVRFARRHGISVGRTKKLMGRQCVIKKHGA